MLSVVSKAVKVQCRRGKGTDGRLGATAGVTVTAVNGAAFPLADPHSVRQSSGVANRRALIGAGLLLSAFPLICSRGCMAASTPSTALCGADCLTAIESLDPITTNSGLQFKDIVVGKGPKPPIGFQAVAHVVTMTQDGQVVDDTKEKNIPYDIRVGAGQVIEGLDEALSTMNVGGLRRLYVPGSLAFKQNLKAAPGRPRIEANTPLIIDVQLLYVPGLDMAEEEAGLDMAEEEESGE